MGQWLTLHTVTILIRRIRRRITWARCTLRKGFCSKSLLWSLGLSLVLKFLKLLSFSLLLWFSFLVFLYLLPNFVNCWVFQGLFFGSSSFVWIVVWRDTATFTKMMVVLRCVWLSWFSISRFNSFCGFFSRLNFSKFTFFWKRFTIIFLFCLFNSSFFQTRQLTRFFIAFTLIFCRHFNWIY